MTDEPVDTQSHIEPHRSSGRPSSYSDEIAEKICDGLANGRSLRQICKDEGMPDRGTVLRWEDKNPDFAAKCTRARGWQGEYVFDEIGEIENAVLVGKITPEQAKVVIGSKQWRAGRLAPKRYGVKVTQELHGPDGGPIKHEHEHSGDESFAAIVAALEAAGRAKSSGGSSSS